MTPDRVETRIGALEFSDGYPMTDTVSRVFDNLDFMRGVEVFLQCIPAASLEAMNLGMQSVGLDACHKALITDRPLLVCVVVWLVVAAIVINFAD